MTENKFEVILLAYLDARAKFDEQFATKYANPQKSVKECAKYICNEMRKKAENGVAVGTDDDVFGMAVHYYDEEDLDCSKLPDNVAKVVASINPAPAKKETKPAAKKAEKATKKTETKTAKAKPAKKADTPNVDKKGQFSLFDPFSM